MVKTQETIDRLGKLGFKKASDKIKRLADKKRKLMIAYEHYRFVSQEKINAFNEKLRKETTEKGMYGSTSYKQLSFTPVGEYDETPPDHVLMAMEEAIDRNCFDTFEVAHIVTVVKTPDPILFGRVNDCPDRFFIAQWDDDVKIEDILTDKEG